MPQFLSAEAQGLLRALFKRNPCNRLGKRLASAAGTPRRGRAGPLPPSPVPAPHSPQAADALGGWEECSRLPPIHGREDSLRSKRPITAQAAQPLAYKPQFPSSLSGGTNSCLSHFLPFGTLEGTLGKLLCLIPLKVKKAQHPRELRFTEGEPSPVHFHNKALRRVPKLLGRVGCPGRPHRLSVHSQHPAGSSGPRP